MDSVLIIRLRANESSLRSVEIFSWRSIFLVSPFCCCCWWWLAFSALRIKAARTRLLPRWRLNRFISFSELLLLILLEVRVCFENFDVLVAMPNLVTFFRSLHRSCAVRFSTRPTSWPRILESLDWKRSGRDLVNSSKLPCKVNNFIFWDDLI